MKSWILFPKITAPLNNERGLAVLITVMVVSLLTAITLHFGLIVRQEIIASTHSKNRAYLDVVTSSGVHLGMAVLEKDGKENDYDSFHDRWGEMSEAKLDGLFDGGALKVEFEDLGGKLQINSLPVNKKSEIVFRRLLRGEAFGLDEEKADVIIDSILDWIDDNDMHRDRGAEDSYYQDLSPSYTPRNGPVEYIDELLMVRGVTPEILFGKGEKKGLANFITVKGNNGKINLNTADSVLLQALGEFVTPELAQKIIDFRKDKANEKSLAEPGWYKLNPAWPGDLELETELLTTKSGYFQINATGTYHSLEKKMVAIVERNKDNEIILLTKKVN